MTVARIIRFRDLLDKAATVDGLELSANVDVTIKQIGRREFEIDSIEFGDIYIENLTYDFLKLDQDSIPRLLRERFERHVEFMALQKAAAASDWEWQYEDQEAAV